MNISSYIPKFEIPKIELPKLGLFDNKEYVEDEQLVILQIRNTTIECPRKFRTELWKGILQRRGLGTKFAKDFEKYSTEEPDATVYHDIEKDIARTFPEHKQVSSRKGQQKLLQLLKAYSCYDKDVGYCQGMNFLAGILLMYLDIEDAFAGLVLLMQERSLREMYTKNMSLLQARLSQLSELLPAKLKQHLLDKGCQPFLYATPWFMTCFATEYHISICARIMDVVLAGDYFIPNMKVALAIMKSIQEPLLQIDDTIEIIEYIRGVPQQLSQEQQHEILNEAFSKQWQLKHQNILKNTEEYKTVEQQLEEYLNNKEGEGNTEEVTQVVPKIEPPPDWYDTNLNNNNNNNSNYKVGQNQNEPSTFKSSSFSSRNNFNGRLSKYNQQSHGARNLNAKNGSLGSFQNKSGSNNDIISNFINKQELQSDTNEKLKQLQSNGLYTQLDISELLDIIKPKNSLDKHDSGEQVYQQPIKIQTYPQDIGKSQHQTNTFSQFNPFQHYNQEVSHKLGQNEGKQKSQEQANQQQHAQLNNQQCNLQSLHSMSDPSIYLKGIQGRQESKDKDYFNQQSTQKNNQQSKYPFQRQSSRSVMDFYPDQGHQNGLNQLGNQEHHDFGRLSDASSNVPRLSSAHKQRSYNQQEMKGYVQDYGQSKGGQGVSHLPESNSWQLSNSQQGQSQSRKSFQRNSSLLRTSSLHIYNSQDLKNTQLSNDQSKGFDNLVQNRYNSIGKHQAIIQPNESSTKQQMQNSTQDYKPIQQKPIQQIVYLSNQNQTQMDQLPSHRHIQLPVSIQNLEQQNQTQLQQSQAPVQQLVAQHQPSSQQQNSQLSFPPQNQLHQHQSFVQQPYRSHINNQQILGQQSSPQQNIYPRNITSNSSMQSSINLNQASSNIQAYNGSNPKQFTWGGQQKPTYTIQHIQDTKVEAPNQSPNDGNTMQNNMNSNIQQNTQQTQRNSLPSHLQQQPQQQLSQGQNQSNLNSLLNYNNSTQIKSQNQIHGNNLSSINSLGQQIQGNQNSGRPLDQTTSRVEYVSQNQHVSDPFLALRNQNQQQQNDVPINNQQNQQRHSGPIVGNQNGGGYMKPPQYRQVSKNISINQTQSPNETQQQRQNQQQNNSQFIFQNINTSSFYHSQDNKQQNLSIFSNDGYNKSSDKNLRLQQISNNGQGNRSIQKCNSQGSINDFYNNSLDNITSNSQLGISGLNEGAQKQNRPMNQKQRISGHF